jgi:hypothetical protein
MEKERRREREKNKKKRGEMGAVRDTTLIITGGGESKILLL